MNNRFIRKSTLTMAIAVALNGVTGISIAQAEEKTDDEVEVIEVTGIRSALASALAVKRNASNIKEVIQAEDIGKLPDSNLAEVLENITGIQISREQGVGTGVQIRGTSENRVEINGVSSVGAGGDRTGIGFDDLPAALISTLEVTKSPTAKTIEGSVGGTINLRTLRGNSLDERLLQFRIQGENSDLADSTTPRFSGTFGDNWQTEHGKVGIVFTGSYAEQDVSSIEPRFDRNRAQLASDTDLDSHQPFNFLRTQFLDSPFNTYNYETKNFTGSIEFEPTKDLKFYFDATMNDQERAQNSYRALASGVGNRPVVNAAINSSFETVNLGSVDGEFGTLDLGEIQVVTSGVLGVAASDDARLDPNLRVSGNTTTRLTKSNIFALGSEWTGDNFQLKAEVSYSDAKTKSPKLSSGMDFINPNAQLPGPNTHSSADNGTPVEFNVSGGMFEWGIAQGLAETPSSADLLNPTNWALSRVDLGLKTQEGSEAAARIDFSYDVSDSMSFITDIHAGIRYNSTNNSTNNVVKNNKFKGWDRPRADLFSDIVSPGPNNFGDTDNRTLFIEDYLMIDGDLAYNDPEAVINGINQALTTNNAATGRTDTLAEPALQVTSFFDIDEETTALYLQGDFEFELDDVFVTGNLGARYINTDLSSIGNTVADDVVTPSKESTSYDFVLPRFNVAVELTDDILIRAGVGKDIRRPDFNDLSISTTFGTTPTDDVKVGNPSLKPEQIWSYDLSFEYYFAPSSLMSVGFFHKERKNLIADFTNVPDDSNLGPSGQIERDVTAPCEGGGIFNPNVPSSNYNVFSSRTDTTGICVVEATKRNVSGSETQTGIELAFQYDLGQYEEQLGWASGFGMIANYTYQESGESLNKFRYADSAINQLLGRTDNDNSTATLADDVVSQRVTLDNLSKNAYNFTLYYDKHDLSVRMRYTWRDAYTSAKKRANFRIAPHYADRGQLNLAVSYDINDTVNVGVAGVNLTREDSSIWCFNDGALLCEQDLTDRRITAGITIKM